MGALEVSPRIEGPYVLGPGVYTHEAGETTGVKRKRGWGQSEKALDPYQLEDAPMENSCCVSEAHLARVTASQTHRPHDMFR